MPLPSVEATTRDGAIAAAREKYGSSARVVAVRKTRSGGLMGFFASERYVAEVEEVQPRRREPAPLSDSRRRIEAALSREDRFDDEDGVPAPARARRTPAASAALPDRVDELAGLLGHGSGEAPEVGVYSRSSFTRAAAASRPAATAGDSAAGGLATGGLATGGLVASGRPATGARAATPQRGRAGAATRPPRTTGLSDVEEPAAPSLFTSALAQVVSDDSEVRAAVEEAVSTAAPRTRAAADRAAGTPRPGRRTSAASAPAAGAGLAAALAAVERAAADKAAAEEAAAERAQATRLAAEQEAARIAAQRAAARIAKERAAAAKAAAAEAARVAAEEEATRLAAEQEAARVAAEQEAAEQEAARLAAEQEAARAAAEREAAAQAAAAEAARLAAERETARVAAEQEAARVAAEQEAARVAAEQEAAAQAAAEAARVAAEQEAARVAAEQEAARVAAEQETARAAAEREAAAQAAAVEAARLAAQRETTRLAAEQAAAAEAARLAAQREAGRLAAQQAAAQQAAADEAARVAAQQQAARMLAEQAAAGAARIAAEYEAARLATEAARAAEPITVEFAIPMDEAVPEWLSEPELAGPATVREEAMAEVLRAALAHDTSDDVLTDILRGVLANASQRPAIRSAEAPERQTWVEGATESDEWEVVADVLAPTASDPAPMPMDSTAILPPLSLLPPRLPGAELAVPPLLRGRPPVPPSRRLPPVPGQAVARVASSRAPQGLATVTSLPVPRAGVRQGASPVVVTSVRERSGGLVPTGGMVDPRMIDAVGVVNRLRALGLPETLLGGGFAADIAANGTYAALTRILAMLPAAPAVPSGPGEVLLVVGPGAETLAAARSLAASLRLDGDRLQWASRGDLANLVPHASRIASVDTAMERKQEALQAGEMTVVAVDAPLRSGGRTWLEQMLAIWAPSAVWAVVEATRKPEDLGPWLDALPRVDALMVQDTDLTADPAAVLSRAAVPVALLDGARATAHRWASLLCERLETVEA